MKIWRGTQHTKRNRFRLNLTFVLSEYCDTYFLYSTTCNMSNYCSSHREILTEQVAMQADCCLLPQYEEHADVVLMSKLAGDCDDCEMEHEHYEDIMSEIYDAICLEISEELTGAYSGDDIDIDWSQLEDLHVPSELVLLCPFCRFEMLAGSSYSYSSPSATFFIISPVYFISDYLFCICLHRRRQGMEADFESCRCECKCGSSFSFENCRSSLTCVGDFRDLLSSVYIRHSSICLTMANVNPGLTLEFLLCGENLRAWCPECGFNELVF